MKAITGTALVVGGLIAWWAFWKAVSILGYMIFGVYI